MNGTKQFTFKMSVLSGMNLKLSYGGKRTDLGQTFSEFLGINTNTEYSLLDSRYLL